MRFDREIFYLKADTESGIEGLVLKNRQQHHYGTSDIGLLHDLLEHPYKPIANPYLDEIAALGAFNEYRCTYQDGNIIRELHATLDDLHVAYTEGSTRLKWDFRYITEVADEVEEAIAEFSYPEWHLKYKYVINYYFNLGASIFHKRFGSYFNSYDNLYYGLGDEIITKLNLLVNSSLENIKLTINYKEREVKVEY